MAGSGWDDSVVGSGVQVNADGTAERPDAGGGGSHAGIRGIAGRAKGKRYFEVSGLNSTCSIGIIDESADVDNTIGSGANPSQWGLWLEYGYIYYRDTGNSGNQIVDDSSTSTTVVGVLMDFDNKKVIFYEDGVEVYDFAMSFADNIVLYPAASMGSSTYGIELQTIEPFQYPPADSYYPWDKPDSSLFSFVSGVVQIDGVPASRQVRAVSMDTETFNLDGLTIQESKPLGRAVSDETTGEYQMLLRDGYTRGVLVFAIDDYGERFTPNSNVNPGDRIHPTTPNGYVYECDGSGSLPTNEPLPWPTDDSQSHNIGTASFSVFPYYRPLIHGPIIPEVIANIDPYFNDVGLLVHFDGDSNDYSQYSRTVNIAGGATVGGSGKFGGGIQLNGTNQYLYVDNDSSLKLLRDGFLEISIRKDAGVSGVRVIATNRPASGSDIENSFSIYLDGNNLVAIFWIDGGGVFQLFSDVGAIADDTIYTLALGIDDTNAYLFIDGFLVDSGVLSSWNDSGNSNPLQFGVDPSNSSRYFGGMFDEIRVTQFCRYTEDYYVDVEPFPNTDQ